MKNYLNRLQNNDAIFDEIRYPTGFSELDKALSGGLVAGLHCIGAISSLGKIIYSSSAQVILLQERINR